MNDDTRASTTSLTELAPHANAEGHRLFMAWISKATPEEVFQSLVDAGIYTPDGKLTERYAPKPDDDQA